MPVIAGARCPPPFPPLRGGRGAIASCARQRSPLAATARAAPPPAGGGRGAIASCARQRSPLAAPARAAPPLSPPCGGGQGGQGGARADHGRASQRLRPSASAGCAARRWTTAADRWAACARALPCDALSLPKRGRCNRPPFPPPAGGGRGGRSATTRCGASSVMKVRERATKAPSSSLPSRGEG